MSSALRRWLRAVFALVAIAVIHRVVQRPLARALERPVSIDIPAKGSHLRVVTWNVRNFPVESDEAYLAARLEELDADVVAFQELRDPVAATRLVPRHVLHVSRGGGRGGQHVGLAYDEAVLERLAGPFEHASLSMGGRVRPALSARLRHRDSGVAFDVVVVHLKATPRGHELRRSQWSHLLEIATRSEIPTFVLGDFNATGPPGESAAVELAALDERLGRAGLRRLETGPCTAYWEGVRHDAWKEPSLLDLVWVRTTTTALWEDLRAHTWGACARYACQPFRSVPAYPDLDLARGSDHCPVSVDVPLDRPVSSRP
jgi:endonuclease/exonuclease/phosphatase family metal-dependent hydrolase